MIKSMVDIKTPDGAMPTHVFKPDAGDTHPLVIFYMDGVGIRTTLIEMAERIAAAGYAVALPNLFYRSGPQPPFDGPTVFRDPKERERLMALIKEVTPGRVITDTKALVAALESAANTEHIGVVGYCMGGGAALTAAGVYAETVLAAASYHGGRLATDAADSPHVFAPRARGRLYIGYAENDASFPDEQREKLESALTQAQVPHTMERYRAAHGFTMRDLPAYDETAANRHWETLFALFRDTLH